MSQRISFSGATIVAGDNFDLIHDVALNVVDGRIFSIGEPIPDAKNIVLDSAILLPMFINAHSHLGDTGAKELGVGIPMEQVVSPPHGLKHKFLSKLNRDDHIQQMRHGIKEMLANGIIACADFREQGLEGVNRLKEAATGLPMIVKILGRCSENSSPSAILEEAKLILEEADGLGIRDVGSYPPSVLKELKNKYPDKLFAVHVAENYATEQKSIQDFGYGQAKRAMEWGVDILVHLTHTRPDELNEIQSANIRVVSCPRSNGILGDGLPNLVNWLEAGISFSLGTDNLMVNSPNMFSEMAYVSRFVRGMNQSASAIDSKTILKSATLNGAIALKMDKDLGSLTAGKLASFIVLNSKSLNLSYSQDLISAIVNRADVHDITSIYIEGEIYKC